MEVKEFVKECQRMFETERGAKTIGIELRVMGNYGYNNSEFVVGLNDKGIEMIEEWSKEHPRKTRKMDFKEKYPKAEYKLDGIGTPNICCKKLGYTDCCPTGKSCVECWNEPVE